MTFDVVIIGAGVVGALTARELMKYNLSVCVLEKNSDVAEGATKANSAIVHGGFDPEIGTEKARLNVRGTELMPALAAELGVKYKNNGSLVLAFDGDELETVNELYHRGYRNGVRGMTVLNKNQTLELEPNISDEVVGALHVPSAGIVCPYQLAIAAMGNAMDNGAELKTRFEVTKIERDGEVFVISSPADRVNARYIVNCAGLYADKISAMIGDDRYHIIPKKGEYLLLDKSEGKLVSHTIFQVPSKVGKGVLVTPTVDGNLLVGPTSEVIDDKECRDTTLAGLDKVRALASRSVKNVPFRKVITSFTGLRAFAGEDFVIEPSVKDAHFINTVGIDSPGLSSAPAIAEEIAKILEKQGLTLTKNKSFNGIRRNHHGFFELSVEEKNEIIARDKRFGRIICRCEGVTEGEIVEAIHQNPKATTVDGVKRRTRARMGRCQGGFCTSYITEILARELGVTEEEIALSADRSKLLCGGEDR